MSGSKQDVVKKGYGNVAPIGVRNIFNKGGQVLPYILKWQKYFDLDFSVNQHPYVIPYQTLTFWTGMWDRATQNTLNFYNLHSVTSGTMFLYSHLTVEVYAVTRQRLLQQGSTNTITYDFETAEHLYVVEVDRDIESYPLVNMASCGPTAIQIPNSYGFDATEDSYTKMAEIPQKMCWTRTFPWPRLKHGYTWRIPRKLDDSKSFTILTAGAQGQTAMLPGTRITQQGEIFGGPDDQDPDGDLRDQQHTGQGKLPETSPRPTSDT
jgi:hypothetical protein